MTAADLSLSRVAVVFGGASPEHDVSILTGLQCERVLSEVGVDVQPLYWTRTGEWYACARGLEARDFLDGAPKDAARLELRLPSPGFVTKKGLGGVKAMEFDAALNCCHGGAGEDGGLNSLFDLVALPLTGGPAAAAALGMDKLAFGAVLRSAGVPVLDRVLVGEQEPPFAGPYIVKPRFGGSSIGIEIVDDWNTAKALAASSVQLRQGAVAEAFHEDAVDLNIAYRTAPQFAVSMLERPLRAGVGIYSYADKYMQAEGLVAAPREMPAKVPPEVEARAAALARQVRDCTDIRGLVRLDFLLRQDELFVNEVNTIPGAMGLYLWPSGGTSASQLLLDLLEETKSRRGRGAPTSFEPGAALRAAGGISSKLGQIGAV